MCGIGGKIVLTSAGTTNRDADVAASQAQACASALAHRGPDGRGFWQHPSNGSFLLHRRLAILDIAGGSQPMTSADGKIVVVFNGEIYNHLELRKQLQAAGHRFATDHSDTEVLVHGWRHWGTQLPEKLRGMFAFAVYDCRDDSLFLARDRLGQKPLYIAPSADGLAFASELPALLKLNASRPQVSLRAIAEYLGLGYMPPHESIYSDIQALAPASWMLAAHGVMQRSIYWPAATGESAQTAASQKVATSESDADIMSEAKRLITSAVESQRLADVPLACFLSGGIDSSIVAALLQQQRIAAGESAIQTLCATFDDPRFNEAPHARAVAQHIGSRHIELKVSPDKRLTPLLHKLMRQSLGEPFADSSLVPTTLIAEAARSVATVALSGDGADELFGGYDRYRALGIVRRWRYGLRSLLPLVPDGGRDSRQRLRRACAESAIGRQYAGLTELFSADELAALGLAPPPMATWMLAAPSRGESPARWAMACDRRLYLPGDVLYKADRASMAHGLEVRSPFLDHHVAEFAARLPDRLLMGRSRGKLLLRRAFGRLLPPEIIARKKHGFGLPIGEWFRGPMRSDLTDRLTDAKSFTRQFLRVAAAEQLLDEHIHDRRSHTHRLFALLMLEIWFAEFAPEIVAG